MKTISNEQLSIQVSPHGAELCSIFANGKEYLWQADPAFGNVTLLSYSLLSEVYGKMNIAMKGFLIRLPNMDLPATWNLRLFLKKDEIHYRLISNGETLQKYPFPFCLEIGYRIQGKQIEVIWKVKNTGDKEMHFQIGAHPAFYW